MARTATNPTTGERFQFDEVARKWVSIAPAQPKSDPASFVTRGAAGLKMTQAGRRNFLISQFGEENVMELPGENLIFRRSPDEQFTMLDPAGPDIGDIADLAGAALEIGPGIGVAAATGTANPAIVAGVDMAGNLARQGISAAIPGSDELTMGERALSTGLTGALAAGSQAGANRLFDVGDFARPRNIVARSTRNQARRKDAVRGAQMQQASGDALTPGQEFNSKMLLAFEGVARRHPMSADLVNEVDKRGIRSAMRALNRRRQQISAADKVETGAAVEDAYFGAVTDAIKLRSRVAARDFGVIDNAGSVPLSIDNVRKRAQELLDETDILGSSPPERAALLRLVKDLDAQPTVNGRKFQNTLSRYSRAASGTGDLFKDVDKAQQKRIGRELLKALESDLDDNVAKVGLQDSSDVAQALRIARDNYRSNSQAIEGFKDSALGRILGGKPGRFSPEEVVDKVIKMKSPSRQRAAIKWLDDQSPETATAVRAQFLEELMSESTPVKVSDEMPPFSPDKFRSALNKKKPQFAALFTGQRMARRDILLLHKAVTRLADNPMAGSPTAPALFSMDMIKQIAAKSGHMLTRPGETLQAAAGGLLGIVGPRRIAQAMADPQGRQALMEITKTGPVTRATAGAVGTLASLWGLDELSEEQQARELQRVRDDPGFGFR